MRYYRALFSIVAVLALLILLFVFVEARSSESCQCYYTGDCAFDEAGNGYRYYWCGGSCSAYGGWHYYPACQDPNYKPRKLFEN